MDASDPVFQTALALAVAYTLVAAGLVKQRLEWRRGHCAGCGRPRAGCACRGRG